MTTSIDKEIVINQAKKEELECKAVSLAKDKEIVERILSVLGYEGEQDLWDNLPSTNYLDDVKVVHASYLNLLARVLLRSTDIKTSENIRNRFADNGIINSPETTSLSAKNTDVLRSKFVNLLEIHGEVRHPSLVEKLKLWFKTLMDKIGGNEVTANQQ